MKTDISHKEHENMKAMVLNKTSLIEANPLIPAEFPESIPQGKQIRVKVSICGICHTELDEIEGRLQAQLPIIPGHQVVGIVEKTGPDVRRFKKGDRVGIAWIYSACGNCKFCRTGSENLCPNFAGTGCDENGGYAQYMVVAEDFAYPIPDKLSDASAAPLLCAGAIGYRALRLTGISNGQTLGLFGFGASAHIVLQLAKYKYPDSKVFVFTRAGQKEHQELATRLGADWAGPTGSTPPEKLNCAIDFTPAWEPVVEAMNVLERGGRLVINAIRKEDKDKESLLRLDYGKHLWLEKEIKSVANITRADVEEFLPIAASIPIIPEVQEFELHDANNALTLLKQGKIRGAGVLRLPQ
jgi:alcohol dehydrogenase, propanol-preferring